MHEVDTPFRMGSLQGPSYLVSEMEKDLDPVRQQPDSDNDWQYGSMMLNTQFDTCYSSSHLDLQWSRHWEHCCFEYGDRFLSLFCWPLESQQVHVYPHRTNWERAACARHLCHCWNFLLHQEAIKGIVLSWNAWQRLSPTIWGPWPMNLAMWSHDGSSCRVAWSTSVAPASWSRWTMRSFPPLIFPLLTSFDEST